MGVIDLPFEGEKGAWTKKYETKLDAATAAQEVSVEVAGIIEKMKEKTVRNRYRLEVYEMVNKLVRFSTDALLALKAYDMAGSEEELQRAREDIQSLHASFSEIRSEMERTYGQTRILNKPANFILDQDHHHHLANQSIGFEWQYVAELAFLEKLYTEIQNW